MPGAEWVGPHHDNGEMQRYDVVCVHTIVGNPPAHAAHFSTRADGHIYQSRDTRFRSAANKDGNHRVIAIENDDWGSPFPAWNDSDGHAVPSFTSQQVEAVARICAWAHKTHGVPLVRCPDSRPGSRGVAYHRQGINGNFLAEGYRYPGRVTGGEVWTRFRGKVCPGDRRIAQLPQIIVRARQLAGLGGGFLVALSDAEQDDLYARVKRIETMLKNVEAFVEPLDDWTTRGQWLAKSVSAIRNADLPELETKVDQLLTDNETAADPGATHT